MIRQAAWIAAVVCMLIGPQAAWSQSGLRLQSGAAVTRGGKKVAAPRLGLALKFGDLLVGPASIGWGGSSRIRALKRAQVELVRHAPEAEWALRLHSGTLIADTGSGRQGFALLLPGHTVAGAQCALSASVERRSARVTAVRGRAEVRLTDGVGGSTRVSAGQTLFLEGADMLPTEARAATSAEIRAAQGLPPAEMDVSTSRPAVSKPDVRPARPAPGKPDVGAQSEASGSSSEVDRIRRQTGMPVTNHFVQRLRDRDITADQVIDVVRNGRLYYDPKYDNTVRWKDGIYVAIGNDNVLITAIRGNVSPRWVRR
ncbi:MAG: DUF4258 domain-containing protein [Armatimonadetes bacterium]|nr:DUF4258 domain-containing protein [Armatimonadota bacterium]